MGVCGLNACAGRSRSEEVRRGDEDADGKGYGCEEAEYILQTIEGVVHRDGVVAQECARDLGGGCCLKKVEGSGVEVWTRW